MAKSFSEDFKKGFWFSLYEYLLITLPVGIYVWLEAEHKHDYTYLVKTPEWAIATIFLLFVGLNKYQHVIKKSGRQFFEPIINIIAIAALVLIILAILNARSSLDIETDGKIIARIIYFIIASLFFFMCMIANHTIKEK
jgi:protein-S-isoprenylcysteine O-methyltransferase Ste14